MIREVAVGATSWPVFAAILCGTILTGCAEPSGTPGSNAFVADAAAGASAAAATIAPVLATDAGRLLDDRDRALSADAEYEALQYGQAGTAKEWRNPGSGHAGAVTPGPAYSVNQYTCRDYSHRVTAGGKQDLVRATACRQPDGSWRPLT